MGTRVETSFEAKFKRDNSQRSSMSLDVGIL
jgi:hypothetical protein